MNQEEVIQSLIEKTRRELSTPPQPVQNSRTWTHPTGYKFLVQWSNAVLLRYFIRLFTSSLPKSEYRRKAQVDDAGRSVVRNIEEGYKRSNTATYIEFISFSQGSLEEVKGDIRELTEDGFLKSKPGSSLASLGLNLGDLNQALKPKGNLEESKGGYQPHSVPSSSPSLSSSPSVTSSPPSSTSSPSVTSSPPSVPSSSPFLSSFNTPLKSSNLKKPNPDSDQSFLYTPLTTLYPPLKKVTAKDLSYEIFIELIQKTDFLFRKLVESLEQKLNNEKLGYKISQSKIKDKIK